MNAATLFRELRREIESSESELLHDKVESLLKDFSTNCLTSNLEERVRIVIEDFGWNCGGFDDPLSEQQLEDMIMKIGSEVDDFTPSEDESSHREESSTSNEGSLTTSFPRNQLASAPQSHQATPSPSSMQRPYDTISSASFENCSGSARAAFAVNSDGVSFDEDLSSGMDGDSDSTDTENEDVEPSQLKPYSFLMGDQCSQKHRTLEFVNCLRFRLRFPHSRRRNKKVAVEAGARDLYHQMINAINTFDAAARLQLFLLLLERRCAIPLVLTNQHHHLPLLRLLRAQHYSLTCLGSNTTIPRVSIVSCLRVDQTHTSEMLQKVFHVESIHSAISNPRNSSWMSTELGCGHIDQMEESDLPVLVLHVTGNFLPLWQFIKEFTDILIIEDSEKSQFNHFVKCPQGSIHDFFNGISDIIVWRRGSFNYSGFTTIGPDDSHHGILHTLFEPPPVPDLFSGISEFLYDRLPNIPSTHSKKLVDIKISPPFKPIACPLLDVDNHSTALEPYSQGDPSFDTFLHILGHPGSCERIIGLFRLDQKLSDESDRISTSSPGGIQRLWRQLIQRYTHHPERNGCFVSLAAQHLLDGLPLELSSGTSIEPNVSWIKEVLGKVESFAGHSKRIFSLAFIQDCSGKSATIVETLLGVKQMLDFDQQQPGITVQLVEAIGCPEYDYVLVLNARIGQQYGNDDNRENQTAISCLLVADAAVVVNIRKQRVKDILSVALLAANGSNFHPPVASMCKPFFVYDFGCGSSDLDEVAGAVIEVVKSVNKGIAELYGEPGLEQQLTHRSSRFLYDLQVDAKGQNSGDVRILKPCKQFPNTMLEINYGEVLLSLREYIHDRIVKTEGWQECSLAQFTKHLENVVLCIQQSSFTSNTNLAMEKASLDKIQSVFCRCESELTLLYLEQCRKVENELFSQVSVTDAKNELSTQVQQKESALMRIQSALSDPQQDRWKIYYQARWEQHQKQLKEYWTRYLEERASARKRFNARLDELKMAMKIKIPELVAVTPELMSDSNLCRETFDEEYEKSLKEIMQKFTPVDVTNEIFNLYQSSPSLQNSSITISEYKPITKLVGDKWAQSFWGNADHDLVTKGTSTVGGIIENCLFKEISQFINDKKCFLDTIIHAIIEKTASVAEKYEFESSEVELAHNLAKDFTTMHFIETQEAWEGENSIPAQFQQPNIRDEAFSFFKAVVRGIAKAKGFVQMLKNNIEGNLLKAFDSHVLKKIELDFRSHPGIHRPEFMQARMDLFLLQLLETEEISCLLAKIRKTDELYQDALNNLIIERFPDLARECQRFREILRLSILSAAKRAGATEKQKAQTFLLHLRHQCAHRLLDSTSFTDLTLDCNGYGECDDVDGSAFINECSNLASILDYNGIIQPRIANWTELVEQVLNFMSREALYSPCAAGCPLCSSSCTLPANHEGRHDTIHQPQGIAGRYWSDTCINPDLRGTLTYETCAGLAEALLDFPKDGFRYSYTEFSTAFPEWMQPRSCQRRTLREYIFAVYNKQIADFYRRKPPVNIPNDYLNSLDELREQICQESTLS